MATITVDPPSDRLSVESIPEIDLRFLTQSELNALSQCSSFSFDLHRTDDIVIPKIDRAVFNESAGSRKQTYSRLRLAPRKPDLSAAKVARPSSVPSDDPERAENLRVVSFFKRLFDPATNDDQLLPVDLFEYRDDYPDDASALGDEGYGAGDRKRKRGRKPKTVKLDGGDVVAGGENKNKTLVVYDESAREREKVLVNKNGVAIDLTQLAGLEDPFGDEIRKRTEGLKADEELLGFMSRLPGQWGSRRKRRRIVDANEFGDALPTGWKILIGMKKKLGQAWLFSRRYVSPNGRYFMSCKEVSSYLRSLRGLAEEASTSDHCNLASAIENKEAPKVEAAPVKVNCGLPSATTLPASSEHEKQIMLVSDASAAKQAGSSKQTGVYKCHRCSTPYYEKNDLLKHLLSCHKRKRRKAGMPVDDFEMLKAGPYNCQFCSKTFYERNVFFAHVGIHVKNYLKGISESGEGTATEKEGSPVPLREIHPTGSEVKWPIDVVYSDRIAVTKPPHTACHNEPHSISVCGGIKNAVSNMEHHVDIADSDSMVVTKPGTESLDEHHSILFSGESKHAVSSMEGHADVVDSDHIAMTKPGTAGRTERHSVPVSGEFNHAVSIKEGNSDIVDSEPTKLPFDKELGASAFEVEGSNADQSTILDRKMSVGVEDELGNVDEVAHSAAADSNFVFVAENPEPVAEDDGAAADSNFIFVAENSAPVAEDDCAHEPTVETKSSVSTTLLGGTIGIDDDNLISKEDKSATSLKEDHEVSLAKENNCIELKQSMSMSELDEGKNNTFPAINGEERPLDTHILKLGDDEDLKLQNVDGEVTHGSIIDEDLTKANTDEISLREKEVTSWPETMLGESITPSSSSLADNQQSCDVDDYADMASKSSAHEGNLEASFLFKKIENEFDFSSDQADEKVSSGMFLFPREENDRASRLTADKVCSDVLPCARSDDFSVTRSFPSRIGFEETCKTESSAANNIVENETKSNELVHSTGMFNLGGGSLVGNVVENEGLEKISASWSHGPQGSREIASNMMHDRSIVNDMASGRTSTADLTDVGTQDNSEADRVIFDFASGVSGISTGVLTSVQADTMAESSSAFCLWNNDQTFDVGSGQNRVQQLGTGQESRQETVSHNSSLSLAGFQQTSNARYNLNESYHIGPLENFSRLNTLEQPRDTDLMIGFRDTNPRPEQGIAARETLWRHGEGDAMPSGLADSSSEQAQVSGAFRSFDFLSDKGVNDNDVVFSMNEKFDSMPSFDGLRSETVEPMEFSFLTPQDSNGHQLQDPKVLPYDNAGMGQGFDSSLWIGRDNSMANLGHQQPVSTIICVWCHNEFQQEPIDPESQAGSIGSLCPACKTGQYL